MKHIATCVTLLTLLLVSGCATPLKIDKTYTAVSQDSRVQYLILHFTAESMGGSVRVLTQGPVSSHYLVSDRQGDTQPKVYQLVDESRRAYHAGVSAWKGATALNASSIGIEIVNLGGRPGPNGLVFQDFDPEQIDRVIELTKDIVARHEIKPERILGHSDIAPTRKNDPGPKFPWKRFADAGLIPWPDAAAVVARKVAYDAALPDVKWFQEKLAQHGFALIVNGEQDALTTSVMAAFQMKYRPLRFDGMRDAETAALLDVLTMPTAKESAPIKAAVNAVNDTHSHD